MDVIVVAGVDAWSGVFNSLICAYNGLIHSGCVKAAGFLLQTVGGRFNCS